MRRCTLLEGVEWGAKSYSPTIVGIINYDRGGMVDAVMIARLRPGDGAEMVTLTALQRWMFLGGLLAGISATAGQEQPGTRPAGAHPAARVEPGEGGKAGSEAPSDAERIARLQRSIDESTRQVKELSAKLNDPASEFKQAESTFVGLDRRLAAMKKDLETAGQEGDETRRQKVERQLGDLETKHKLAKDRFDLAIRERKTRQEQVKTLQQKIQQDTDALKKLMGEKPAAATQPAAEAAPSVPPAAAAAPANVPAVSANVPAAGALKAPSPTGAATPAGAPGQPGPAGVVLEKATPEKPAPELVEARQEASRKQVEAQDAQAELASITERMNALHKSIELEQRQLKTSRQKAENAQETERTLYDALQKRWEAGSSQKALSELRRQIGEARDRLRETQNEIRDRTDRLGQYQSELSALQAEHIAAMEESQRRSAEAEQAERRVGHLESPLSPQNLWRWAQEHGPRVGGIIVAMIAGLWLSRVGEGRVVRLMGGRGEPGRAEDRQNRAKTLGGVVHSAAAIAIYVGGGLMMLTEVGVNIVPLMGGAAVFGLAAAFGAQNLIRDYFYGFTILLENQYAINDVVKIGDVSGQVERITLRVTVLRGLDGTVHFVPNGEITRVSNMTHEWSRALFAIPVAYKEDVDRVMEELVELAKELRREPEYRGLILEMPEMLGVDEFADSAVVIKFLIKTRPLKQWIVKRELLRRIKKRFDEVGIEIPFPHRTVFHRYEAGVAAGEDDAVAAGGEQGARAHGGRPAG